LRSMSTIRFCARFSITPLQSETCRCASDDEPTSAASNPDTTLLLVAAMPLRLPANADTRVRISVTCPMKAMWFAYTPHPER
jgi:hypothetical protein